MMILKLKMMVMIITIQPSLQFASFFILDYFKKIVLMIKMSILTMIFKPMTVKWYFDYGDNIYDDDDVYDDVDDDDEQAGELLATFEMFEWSGCEGNNLVG